MDSAPRVEGSSESLPVQGVVSVATGSLAEACQMENACWEILKVKERQLGAKIAEIRAEIEAQRDKWAFYYGEVKRHRAANK